jgi:hypothetical protein
LSLRYQNCGNMSFDLKHGTPNEMTDTLKLIILCPRTIVMLAESPYADILAYSQHTYAATMRFAGRRCTLCSTKHCSKSIDL